MNEKEELKKLKNDCSILEGQVKLLVKTELKLRRTQAELVDSKEKIKEYSKTLEQKVEERTKEIKESYNFIESVISSMTDSFIVIDTNGKIIKLNQSMINLIKKKEDDKDNENIEKFIGKNIIEFLPIKQIIKDPDTGLFKINKPLINFELDYITSDDISLVLSLSASPVFDTNNNIVSTVIIIHNITNLKNIERNLKHIATHDTLTNLPNRILLNDRINQAISKASRNKQLVPILLIDLDHFKEINDTLGHDAGDFLLKEISVRIKSSLREYDTASRMGGDEFVIALCDIISEDDISIVAERLLNSFNDPITIDNHIINITSSIGISIYPNDGDDIESLLKHADIAMYSAKEMGGNRFCFFKSKMGKILKEKLKIRDNLKKAIERNEFILHYQPLVETDSGKYFAAEALIRWNHPELGFIGPLNFIDIAEKTGLILPIGKWVLRTACNQGRIWHCNGLNKLSIAVNLSVVQLYEKNMVNNLIEILDETKFSPENLILEITESTAMHNIEISTKVIKKLNKLGIKVYIDDFGSGYSSLNRLKTLPIYALKIDKFFIQNVVDDPFDAAIVRAIILMAHSLNIKVIAEGVETKEQLNFLKSIELKYEKILVCDNVQGYLFSKPVNAEEFTLLLKNSEK